MKFYKKKKGLDLGATIERRLGQVKGRAAEVWFPAQATLEGYKVKRTGKGHDFLIRKMDLLSGREVGRRKYVEIKTGKAKLTKLQRKMKKKYGSQYEVIRYI
jgi:hypothetical protein